MAIFVFRMKTFSRTAGRRGSRATSAAAYRAGERIRDQRTGAVYDHRRRADVLHREIVLPKALERAGVQPTWARDRSALWNAAENAEPRRNARVAREFMVALPHELTAAERLMLARGFARELVERYHTAVDLVLHAPRGDERNFHAHLLSTTRRISNRGLEGKADLELSGTKRHQQGLLRWEQERRWLRERWASLTNEALEAAHLTARVTSGYGVADPIRMPRLPSIAYHIEQRGGHSSWAERIRQRHRQALEQSVQRRVEPDEPSAVSWLQRIGVQARAAWVAFSTTMQQPDCAKSASHQHGTGADDSLRSASTSTSELIQDSYRSPTQIEELARHSVERWKAYRQEQSKTLGGQQQAGRDVDIDLGF